MYPGLQRILLVEKVSASVRITPQGGHIRHLHRIRPQTTLPRTNTTRHDTLILRTRDEAGRLNQLPRTPPSQFQILSSMDVASNTPPREAGPQTLHPRGPALRDIGRWQRGDAGR